MPTHRRNELKKFRTRTFFEIFLTSTIPNHKVLRYDQESSQNLKKNQSNKISYLQKFLVGSAVTVATRVCDLEETESGKIKLFVNDNQTNVFENASINGEIPDPSTISGIS